MADKTVTIEVTITEEAAKNLFEATVRSGVSDLPSVSIQEVLSALLCRPFFADLLIRMTSVDVNETSIEKIDDRYQVISKAIKYEYLNSRVKYLDEAQLAFLRNLFPMGINKLDHGQLMRAIQLVDRTLKKFPHQLGAKQVASIQSEGC
jgi:hypothetical protein